MYSISHKSFPSAEFVERIATKLLLPNYQYSPNLVWAFYVLINYYFLPSLHLFWEQHQNEPIKGIHLTLLIHSWTKITTMKTMEIQMMIFWERWSAKNFLCWLSWESCSPSCLLLMSTLQLIPGLMSVSLLVLLHGCHEEVGTSSLVPWGSLARP